MHLQKIAVISHWNVEGALQSPICITWLLNVPSTVANAILWTCSSTMCICWYASDILSFEWYAALAISLWMISWSGNGVTSLTMLSFCSHRLKTVCSLPFFFGMQSLGITWCATAGIHHCVVVYLSIFWESALWKCSGVIYHCNGWWIYSRQQNRLDVWEFWIVHWIYILIKWLKFWKYSDIYYPISAIKQIRNLENRLRTSRDTIISYPRYHSNGFVADN